MKVIGAEFMRKRQLMFMAIIFIVILTGCSNKKYDSAMDNGKVAIENEEYEKAQSYFEQAIKEKPDDQQAIIYLDQTRNTLAANILFEDGKFDESIDVLNDIFKEDSSSSTLHTRAEKQLIVIKKIKTDYDYLEKSLEDAKKLADNNEYEEAISLINQALDNNSNNISLNPLKENLIKLKTDFEVAMIEKAKQDKQNQENELINKVIGYWSYSDNDNELCEFKKDYFVCAVMESDFYYYERINSWDVDLNNQKITIDIKDGSPINISITNSNKLILGKESYNRNSKNEIEEKLANYYDGTLEEFFDIEMLEEWDSHN